MWLNVKGKDSHTCSASLFPWYDDSRHLYYNSTTTPTQLPLKLSKSQTLKPLNFNFLNFTPTLDSPSDSRYPAAPHAAPAGPGPKAPRPWLSAAARP